MPKPKPHAAPWQAALASLAIAREKAALPQLAAQPEDQLKGPVQRLIQAAGERLSLQVDSRTEVRVPEVRGRPDVGVTAAGLLCGFIELKAPGKGARTERLKGADREQWERFRDFPNLLYTDGWEWALYRSGQLQGSLVRLDVEGAEVALFDLLRVYLNWQPIVPTSPKALAEMLAPLCHLLRREVIEALGRPGSAVQQVAADWREALFPEADDGQFADAYAQTITYTLLLARFEGSGEVLETEAAERTLRRKHGLLAQALRVLADPQARAEIETAVSLLERSIAEVDPTIQNRPTGDPWLYFYEDFLAQYDPKLRRDRGVYYTPVEVVSCQCRLIAELLRDRFGKRLGFADDGVTVLDPAVGTGAYLLAAFQLGREAATEHLGPGAVPALATRMAERFHGFEILVGPYAVAHMRLTQAIRAAEGEIPDDGVHVYLTDALENPHEKILTKLPLHHRLLAEEHRRAQKVKLETPILVCLGNPPYNRQSIEPGDTETDVKGGWVRHGEGGRGTDGILQDFLRPVRNAGQSVHLKNVYNDYVYFWRWALWKVFEEKTAGDQNLPATPGIVSFITASSYLHGPGFAGMRQMMRQTFDELWIIDLEGDSLGPRKTENVFAIKTPVAIAVGVRYGAERPDQPARVHYARIEGTREAKLAVLRATERFANFDWRDCPEEWLAPFLPVGEGAFFSWPLLTDLFPWQHSGVQFKRTWPISSVPNVLDQRWRRLMTSSLIEKRKLFRETAARRIDAGCRDLDGSPLPALSAMAKDEGPPRLSRFGFRSFDRQWALLDPRLADRVRPGLIHSFSSRQVFLTSLLSVPLGAGPAATVSAHVPDLHHFRGSYGAKDVIPLYRDADAAEANVTHNLLGVLADGLGRTVSAEDLFAYAYALLASPEYVRRSWDELALSPPRLPISRDAVLFTRTVRLGRRLIHLHTHGERFGERRAQSIPSGRARASRAIPTQTERYPESYSYDEATGTLRVGEGAFAPIQPEVWSFAVSGLGVVESWLSYRMRDGAGRASSSLDEIRPDRWTADLTQELLELLWVLEGTIDLYPELREVFDRITAEPVFLARELPAPRPGERQAPRFEADEEQLSLLAM